MSIHEWKSWTVVHRNCFLGPSFEISGDDETYSDIQDGSGSYAIVKENEYPPETFFTVEITITPRPPKEPNAIQNQERSQ
jgi:hypothetical protein